MKKLIFLLLLLVAALQYRLWFGDGGIREYQRLQARIEDLKFEGEKRSERNAALDADVRDLREGTDAIEERARQELGLVKEGETFVQVFDKPGTPLNDDSDPEPEKRPVVKPSKRHRKSTR